MSDKVAVLFPGQGAYYGGVFHELSSAYPQIQAVFAEIEQVAVDKLGQSISELLFAENKLELPDFLERHPDLLQMALYGIGVASYKLLEAQGFRPEVMIGHSFGEIAALVCAGAYTIRQGAEIVCHRIHALQQLGHVQGSMLALSTDLQRVEHLLGLLREPNAVVSVLNHPGQIVVSGPDDRIRVLKDVCKAVNISTVLLKSPYPFHNPMLAPAVEEFARRLKQIEQAPLQVPVYSPILGRTYSDEDDLGACLAEHFVRPVNFSAGIRGAFEAGVRVFVECGARDALCKATHTILKGEEGFVTIPLLQNGVGEKISLAHAEGILRDRGLLAANLLDQFWASHGAQIQNYIHQELLTFLNQQVGTLGEVAVAGTREDVQEVQVVQEVHAPAVAKPQRQQVYQELVAFYAEALEYPEEVFTEDVALEAELGVDSVKQTELMARVSEQYNLPPRPSDFRLSDYPTMGQIAAYVYEKLPDGAPADVSDTAPSGSVTTLAPTAPDAPATPAAPAREQLFGQLVSLYAEALEYPEEVFTEDVALEAELGVDSVKQTELMARVSEQYNLPPRQADFRLSDYPTMGQITDFVHSMMTKEVARV
ncbi:acyltransferase domain-containing protein [Tumebacillus permanentifrigoris]|uniref:[acyl-carrier-protein] S-malonyltransferase n=1 Tax=Tumebacillus permanentifrigoris TaxID=378543 RepID=A0A316D9Q7_9BACL|nr:acyltransferase domain-containing protein [Tumebacillus permanentifrigoris]PWK13931.1 malonyl CoA-acyl carrier protein transacylase [Tumebacillus permanentifrigoris]